MVKNRNKKKRKADVSMDISKETVIDLPQAMDMLESGAQNPASGAPIKKVKKERPMKRSKNVRKTKSIDKAISKNEMYGEKNLKLENKKTRTQSAPKLYMTKESRIPIYRAIHYISDLESSNPSCDLCISFGIFSFTIG
ncbi:hypothetical protein F2P56_018610 [Juglans regia]|uniref:Uncharacterized protein n=1 Tax=Juglans regia TaxID=51240 RepID=A0A833UA24_JUGRE|nr:hypothetical protein F2P56_018610 [Juglans regia]